MQPNKVMCKCVNKFEVQSNSLTDFFSTENILHLGTFYFKIII